MLLDIAHLIERKHVERYQSKFSTTSAMLKECQMQLSGPWPPYHFVHHLTRPAHPHPATSQPSQASVHIPAPAILIPEQIPAMA
jgi:hypothetical protein